MVGTAKKKENSAAVLRSTPIIRPPIIVAPERLTPGNIAVHCTRPMDKAVPKGISSTAWKRTVFTTRSNTRMRMPPIISAKATISGVCIAARMASYANTPITKAGAKPNRILRVNATAPASRFSKPVPTAQNRRQYTNKTAKIAPSWIAILKATELLSVKPTSSPAKIRWPVDDTGKNSVSPSIKPRSNAIIVSLMLWNRRQSGHVCGKCSTNRRQ